MPSGCVFFLCDLLWLFPHFLSYPGATLALPSPLLYPSSRENIEQWKHDLEPYLLSSENRAEVGAVDTAMSHLAAAEEEEEEEESELEGRLVGREAGGDVLVSGGWRDVFKCPGSLEKADRFQLDWTDLAGLPDGICISILDKYCLFLIFDNMLTVL